MYNRYIPQPDGSYRRNRINEPVREPPRPAPPKPEPPPDPPCACPQQEVPPCQNGQPCAHMRPPQRPVPPPNRPPQAMGIGSFLKQLVPKGFDTEDLLIVLLLLLMAGDCQEDQNTALLTLALYLFL